jgi:energy-coupling factor transport system ATP-binding protein
VSESIIKVKNLSFTYPAGVTALRNINLEINKGEVIAIIGQNGSGKTTLVKHFNGLLTPTKGDVFVNKNNTKDKTTAQLSRIIGYVFQDPDDQIFMGSVKKEVEFGPKNLELSKDETRRNVKESLKLIGLWDLRHKHPLDLNLNEKKLVAMASIIAMRPEVIILDEPTTGQDHKGIKKVESLIKELSKEHTVIIISHNMDLVSKIATKVIVMYDSRIIMQGTPKEVFVKNGLLNKTYLKPPAITQLAQSIKGFKRNILTIDEFINELQKTSK